MQLHVGLHILGYVFRHRSDVDSIPRLHFMFASIPSFRLSVRWDERVANSFLFFDAKWQTAGTSRECDTAFMIVSTDRPRLTR